MKHKYKLKLARKLMTKEERKDHVSPFCCSAWLGRQSTRLLKEINRVK